MEWNVWSEQRGRLCYLPHMPLTPHEPRSIPQSRTSTLHQSITADCRLLLPLSPPSSFQQQHPQTRQQLSLLLRSGHTEQGAAACVPTSFTTGASTRTSHATRLAHTMLRLDCLSFVSPSTPPPFLLSTAAPSMHSACFCCAWRTLPARTCTWPISDNKAAVGDVSWPQ